MPQSIIVLRTSIDNSQPFRDISFDFSGPVDFFSLMVLDAEETFGFEAYLGNTLVQTEGPSSANLVGNRPDGPFRGDVYNLVLGGIGGAVLFDRVVVNLTDGIGAGPEEYDNLVFNTVAPVPIPAALPLFLSGLIGLGILGRRRKRV